tara:strand:+ start:1016 stop:1750 length:735 start_codon:yes stop_codon:yes gene_type:complete
MGKHKMNPRKKKVKTENYKSLNQAYAIEDSSEFFQNESFGDEQVILNWKFKEPIEAYNYLTNYYGMCDVLGHEQGGIAIWHKSLQNKIDSLTGFPNIYKKIEIKDEHVLHKCPAEHVDFLYSYIDIPITPEQLVDVIKLSGSVNYDMLKHELFARCGSLEANIATLYLSSEIIMSHINKNHMSIKQIHEGGEYKKHINATINPDFVKDMYKKLSDNIKSIKQVNKLPSNHWPGAFTNNCDSPYY